MRFWKHKYPAYSGRNSLIFDSSPTVDTNSGGLFEIGVAYDVRLPTAYEILNLLNCNGL